MPSDLQKIRQHYARMDDAKLERIAKFGMSGLRPDVYPIVVAEVRKRGWGEEFLAGMDAQRTPLN